MLRGIVQNYANSTLAHFRGELFVVLLLMLHPTQGLEPVENPAGFSPQMGVCWMICGIKNSTRC